MTPPFGSTTSEQEILASHLFSKKVWSSPIHACVIGELACGMLNNRSEILGLLQALPKARVADDPEVLHLLESQKLYGLGLGWVDINLLASAQLTGCGLWTDDGSLQKAAIKLHIPVHE